MGYTYNAGTPAAGRGAGGAGGAAANYDASRYGLGGKAGAFVQTQDIDVSAYTGTLSLVVTIGAGGAGGDYAGTDVSRDGTAGAPGQVIYSTQAGVEVPADVLPIRPTAVGSFSKAANATGATVFPDLGPGLWVIDTGTSDAYLYIGTIQIDSFGSVIDIRSATRAQFISEIRPNITAGMNAARTINFKFYSMTQWG